MRLRWIAESDVEPLRALSVGNALYRGLDGADAPPVFLYGASLTDDVVVLGRNQRALDALNIAAVGGRGVEVVRRATGGPACIGGRGIFYVALGLRHASALMECPRDRVLNRNVRGILGGLALTGVRAQYFGREWISVDKRPAALIGWTRLPEGAVLVEAFLSIDRPYWLPDELHGYPTREEMTLEAKDPILMSELWKEPRTAEELTRSLAEGHVDRFPDRELELDHSSLSDGERESADQQRTRNTVGFDDAWDALTWSSVREVPIGFISAGVALDEEGVVKSAAIAGDFYQDEEAAEVLTKKLEGEAPTREAFAAAVEAAWDGQNHVVEGLKDVTPVVDALVEAAGGKP
jgi:hypothetical protein